MLSKVVADTFKKYGVSVGSRIAVNATCSNEALTSLRMFNKSHFIPSWQPRMTLAGLAEHMADFVVTEDMSMKATNTELCKSLGIYHLPTGLSVPDSSTSTQEESPGVVLQVSSGHRCLQLSQEQLDAQVTNLSNLITITSEEHLVILDLGFTSSWILNGLAFSEYNPTFIHSLQIEKFPARDFTLLCDYPTFRELSEFVKTEKDLPHRISRIFVDLPTNFADLEISTCNFRHFTLHCTTPETGSLFLLDREARSILKRSSTEIRIKNGRLQASGPAAKAHYLNRPRSNEVMTDGDWINTGYAMTFEDDNQVSWFVSPPSIRDVPVSDLMEPDWSVDSKPLNRMRLRRGSKNQRYLTNKSQVSAFYRKRYFHRQTMKSRAVVRK